MMNELTKALKPVKRRIRRNRLLRGAAWGLAAGLGAALAIRGAGMFVPMANRWLWAAIPAAAATVTAAAGNALRPVGNRTAAETADRCGLQERTITALEQAGTETEICVLQREDACRALREMDTGSITAGSVKKPLLTALGCGVLLCALLIIPGRGDRAAEAQKALRETLRTAAEEIGQAAEADAERLNEARKSELRRLTGDLKRELDRSRDEADALVALDRAERRLEEMQNRTAGDAAAAADREGTGNADGEGGEGTEAAATAGEAGTEISGTQAKTAGNSTAGRNGTPLTQKALAALKARVSPATAQQGNRGAAAAAKTGSGQGEGPGEGQGLSGAGSGQGNKSANGAGEGSTNLEAEAGGKNGNGPVRGNRDPKYREEKYETIYDPERTETAARDEMTNQNRQGEAESRQAETGPGKGSADGSVPWDRVFREYRETETRSAGRENLTTKERQWVEEYYSLLTEQQ